MLGSEFDAIARPLAQKIAGVDSSCCPQCGQLFSQKVQRSLADGGRVKCQHCDFYGNWRFGTILHNSRLSNTQFIALFFRYTVAADAPAIAAQLGLDPATVRYWRDRILSADLGAK